jgi:adenylylsulfate kinase-like enzyme
MSLVDLSEDEKFFLGEILDAEIGEDKSFLEAPDGDNIARGIIRKLGYNRGDHKRRSRIFG